MTSGSGWASTPDPVGTNTIGSAPDAGPTTVRARTARQPAREAQIGRPVARPFFPSIVKKPFPTRRGGDLRPYLRPARTAIRVRATMTLLSAKLQRRAQV